MALEETHLSVLLIEDNPGDARLVEHHLDTAVTDQYVDKVSLSQARSLQIGLDMAQKRTFDVLFLDLGLPESTGLETVDRVLESELQLPIVVLTGLDDREMSVEAISRGAQDYLPKDELDSDRLIRSLRYAIERHEHEEALRRQTEQMEFFNQILRHDMLNGMNVIQARGEILADDLDGEEAAFAETIVDWSDDIIDLTQKIRAILDTLTADSQPELKPIDLRPLLQTAAERAESMGAETTIDVPDGLAVRADPLLEDALSNLTTNAAEHGGDGVSIRVTAEPVGDRVQITVADDGSGVPEHLADEIFERGQKGSQSTGSGFGLYFVASMVDAYGGSVSVEPSEDDGAKFVLTLQSTREPDNLR